MKNFIITTLLLGLFSFTNQLEAHTPVDLSCTIELPNGTLVSLETTEQIQSNKMTVGRIIKCKITTDVVVDGKVVIRTGAIAYARVTRITPTTYNGPEQVTLSAINAQAVDGQIIALNGIEQTFKGRLPGQPMNVYIGTPLSAHVTNNYEVSF
ncbi:MAG: hypothetical protein KI786_11105 [Mameliella sp.]|nr:hypothetical protein [Phaeodactylibacter sp.]